MWVQAKGKKSEDLFYASHQQVISSCLLGSWALPQVLLQKVNVVNNQCNPLSSSFLLPFISEQASHGMEYPFGQFGSVILVISPARILTTSLLLVMEEHWRDWADAVLVLPSCRQSTGVLSALSSHQKHCGQLWGKLSLYRADPTQRAA